MYLCRPDWRLHHARTGVPSRLGHSWKISLQLAATTRDEENFHIVENLLVEKYWLPYDIFYRRRETYGRYHWRPR
jgi:hypothetical protein